MSQSNAWYISSAKGAEGPFATELMRAMIREQRLKPLDLVFREGEDEWRPISMYSELHPDAEQMHALRARQAASKRPDFSASQVSTSASDGTEPHSDGDHEWIVLRPQGVTFLQEGPFGTDQIREGLKVGLFNFGQYVWHVGMTRWMRIGDLREFDRRSTPREVTPHVPPPLPDPISAVLLEDDGDIEFNKSESVPKIEVIADSPPADSFNFKNSMVRLGGAAAKAETAESAGIEPVETEDLAKVPWEGRRESSGLHVVSMALLEEAPVMSQEDVPTDRTDLGRKVKSDSPYIAVSNEPPMTNLGISNSWNKWGKYISAMGLAFVFGTFVLHLATVPQVQVKRPAYIATESDNLPNQIGQENSPVAQASNETGSETVIPSPPHAAPANSDLEIVGFKLDGPDASLVFQGAIPSGETVSVTFRGRLGEVLGSLNVRKTVTVLRRDGEIPSLSLKNLRLPAGAYTVEASTSNGLSQKTDIFLGKRDARFLDQLETYLRENSFELQNQKKLLFYASQELDVLARELALKYGQLRSNSDLWGQFYQKWLGKVSIVEKSVAGLLTRDSQDLAYPQETEHLVGLIKALKETAAQFENGVGASRDVASDGLTDLIAELSRHKSLIGAVSARPTRQTSDESDQGSQ